MKYYIKKMKYLCSPFNIKGIKTILILLTPAILSSCCWSYLFPSTELSSIKTEDYGEYKGVTSIKSDNHLVRIYPSQLGKVLSYSLDDESVIHYPGGLETTVPFSVYTVSEEIKTPILFEQTQNYVYPPDTVLVTGLSDEFSVKNIFKMNTEYGDVYNQQIIKNISSLSQNIYTESITNLRSDGYLILPLDIISDLPQTWKLVKGDIKNTKIIDNKLIVDCSLFPTHIQANINTGHYVYVYKNLVFIDFFKLNRNSSNHNLYNLNLQQNRNYIQIRTYSSNIMLSNNEEYKNTTKWILMNTDKPVESLDDAYDVYNSLNLNLLLRR